MKKKSKTKVNPLMAKRNELIYEEYNQLYNPMVKKIQLCATIGKPYFMTGENVYCIITKMSKEAKKKK